MKVELVRTVLSDLAHLRDSWNRDVSEDALRRDSGILRKLVVDRHLHYAWNHIRPLAAGPSIACFDLKAALARFPQKSNEFIFAGLASHGRMTILGAFVVSPKLTKEETEKLMQLGPPTVTLPFTKYREGGCLVVKNEVITRMEVIKFICNMSGGIHLGPPKNEREAKVQVLLDEIRSPKFRRRHGKSGGWTLTDDFDPVYLSLLSIGQEIVRSNDIVALLDDPLLKSWGGEGPLPALPRT